MKNNSNFKKGSCWTCSINNLSIKSVIICILILTGIQSSLKAQVYTYTKPSWWFGAAAGANFNFYRGTTQHLNSDITVPKAFHSGNGIGLYVAPLIEFHRPDARWGVMLQGGLDSRRGSFKQVTNPCNCPADLSTDLSYVTIEPSLRLAPFKGNFYLYAGPRIGLNMTKSFTYKIGTNPEYPAQPANLEIKGDLNNMNKTLISGQIGAGYDIYLSSQNKQTQFVLSPFIAFQPYFGQDPRSVDSWNVTTVRAGVALKLGRGHRISPSPKDTVPEKKVVEVAVVKTPETKFSVNAPKNVPVVHRITETFPLRNYVFFDLGSAAIPARYELLSKDEVKDFKEDQLEVFTPKNLNGRAKRQMTVYYNVLNILGDRMGKNKKATIILVGSSEKGPDDGRVMAESVKQYLVTVFGINASRINIEGRDKPKIPSEQVGGVLELELLRAGDRRVSIESSSSDLLMEFQSGPHAPLKGVEIIEVKESIDSNITFNLEGAKDAFKSWSLEVKDKDGKVLNFGPYTSEKVTIPGKTILGSRPEGDYRITMVGLTKDGKTVRKETSAHLVNYTPPKVEEGLRYSVLFEFNDSKAITIYEKYLAEVVTPKIPAGGTVIIHGHTDIIGDEVHNKDLSLARANDVKNIIEKALAKAGRKDVKFEVYGYGEDESKSPFENKYPEEHFYNRTVIIDLVPAK